MRKFSSYGPIVNASEFYAPREELIEKTYINLIGENPPEGGHYFTVWAPRQTGKTWLMQQILHRLKKDPRFHTLKINLEILKRKTNVGEILQILAREIGNGLGKTFEGIDDEFKFQRIFKNDLLDKPLILILDEFDAIDE
ncbi:MAG: AAA-like domain-containing protein, partial [Acidobacteria bacterium]|nr:AAA-like domain-containing protein [Acidobacteriota bacterium]